MPVSLNTLCLGPGSFEAHVEQTARIGAAAISPEREEIFAHGVPAARRLLRDCGLAAATLTHRAFAFINPAAAQAARQRLDETIDAAASIGASSITFTTGGRGDLPWAEAARRFVAEIAPCAARARAAGISLALEPTSHLYADASIVHRLHDAAMLARQAGIGAGIDLFACWSDADIESAIKAAAPDIALVQVSDYRYGDRALPCRAVPGDGDIPLARLMSLILDTGFRGYFDLEIIGPRLAAEGVETGLRRALAWMAPHLSQTLRPSSPGR